MGSLIAAELLRFRSRRLVKVLLLLAVGGILLSAFVTFITTDDLSDAANGEVRVTSPELEACLRGEFGGPVDDPEVLADFCESNFAFTVDDQVARLTDFQDIFLGVSIPLMMIGWLLGASAMGAEWQKGTVTTVLTWEPSRARVFVARLLAVLISVSAISYALLALLALVLYPTVALKGSTAGVDAEWMRETAELLLRCGAGIAITTAIGYAVASMGRNTAAALGAGFLYIVIVENVMRALKPMWQRWFLADNLGVFLSADPGSFDVGARSVGGAGLLVAFYAVMLLGVAYAWFAQRDVT